MYRLEDLNPVQCQAVEHREGPLLILAGAGSGKTRVLTYRIAHLIAQGIDPWNILAITFTNKAAQEMRERVYSLVGSEGRGLWVATFHSACVRILRNEIGYLPGYSRSFVIYDSGDQLAVVKSCMKELALDEKKFAPRAILSTISDAKNKLQTPDDFSRRATDYFEQKVESVYNLYQKKLIGNNALDFDDIIMLTVRLFRENPEVLAQYQDKFRYILVDEYQDTNHAQYALINLLAKKYRNLCVVGDDDQSIYMFRGADVKNILDFERDYPEAKVLKLEQNYRSTKSILQAANAVVQNNTERKEKSLWTDNEDGQPIVYYVSENEHDEARYMAERIQRLLNVEGRRFNDFAVLYRTNAQSRVVEERFMREGIPYRIFSGLKFYERMEIKDILAYLRILHNPADQVSFSRVLNVPKRGLGESTLEKILDYATEQEMPVLDAIMEANYIPELQTRAKKPLLAFAQLMQELKTLAVEESSVTRLVEEILKRTGYWDNLIGDKSPEAEARQENIREFLSVTAEYDEKADQYEETVEVEGMEEAVRPGLAGFLEQVSLVAQIDTLDQGDEAVVMMTIHSAKGLEFPVVFIGGMEEGIFPSSRSMLDPVLLAEERRLCYVAITRARERLYLSYAQQRMLYGRTQYNRPSEFFQEIPTQILVDRDPIDPPTKRMQKPRPATVSAGSTTSEVSPWRVGERNIGNPIMDAPGLDYKVGEKVEHAKFGKGVIVAIKGEGSSAELSVVFGGEIKKLIAEYAKLMKL
ncbi:ATP-dependent DNA helicase PcrA [Desulfitobacterium dichloroeliminans LMG P-21439]|uniref:ATP-dependent DNA helicase n=1 Tax=Desulfitobacterium dichloroeliminans (strain LMG P-21439 / DCA1) TaxID=871963 RepID=L0F4K6_DESDL|nr:DNA helicase PcrA [Desulfitobacterium dichloroeliminans]AGA68769.1 ATP-dependent DNA helicase PcrA [Desulfitobacterium dichloroeliminans LMG P-21439]